MRRKIICVLPISILIILGIFVILEPMEFGSAQSIVGPYQCYQGSKGESYFPTVSRGGGKLRVSGFTIEVRPEINPEYMNCFATVWSPKGDAIFEINDYGMDIASISGKDINGDGRPEVVIEAFSGGAHCCWTDYIVSLGQSPRLIAKIESTHGVGYKDLDADGVMEIQLRDGSFDYFHSTYVDSPHPLLILRLEGNEFRDVGAEFQEIYDKKLNEDRASLDRYRQIHIQEPKRSDVASDETRSVLNIVLDYLYSGRPKEAWESLEELWLGRDWEKIRNEILEKYCRGLRAEIRVQTGTACVNNQ